MILKQFDGAAVAPRDDAILYNAIIKKNGVFSGMEITHIGSNQLHITAGRGILKGRVWEQEEETIHCNLASSGTLEGRAYIHMDLTDMDTPIKIMTVAAASLPDLIQDEECNYTNGIYEMELCTYNVTDLAISNLEVTYNNISEILPIIEKMTDLAALTEKGYVADALLVAELNKKIEDRDASFRDGLSQIATSITDMGVTTASNASPETMASNIKKLVSTLSSSNQITSGNAGGYAENSPTVTLTYTATKECYVMVHLSAYYHNSGGSSTFTISGGTIIMDTGKKGTYSSAYQLTLVKLSKGTKLTMTAKNAGNISYSSREVAYIVFAI